MKNEDMQPQVAELNPAEIDEVAGGWSFWDWYFGRGSAGAKDG